MYCTKCGTKNNDEDRFCRYCGAPITEEIIAAQKHWRQGQSGALGDIKNGARTRMGEGPGRACKRMGEEVGGTGKDFDYGMRRTGNRVSGWYDRTFGLFGPLLSAFFSLLVLVMTILGLMVLAGTRLVWVDLTNFVITYLPLFFMLGLLGSYSTYFSWNYHSRFKWVTPLTTAVSITAGFWIVASILIILDSGLEIPYIGTIASWISLLLPAIFIIAVVAGYLGLILLETARRRRTE